MRMFRNFCELAAVIMQGQPAVALGREIDAAEVFTGSERKTMQFCAHKG